MSKSRFRPSLPDKIAALLQEHGGVLRTSQALKAGVHPRTLYALRDTGALEQLSRGLYRFAGAPPLANPDLVTVARRVPQGVVCLISALAFHELTTQVPHEVQLALPRGAEPPRIEHPPIRTFWFTSRAFQAGIQVHQLDGTPVRIYGPEKTLADCFKYRNKIGLDTAMEGIRLYKEHRRVNVNALMKYAEACRVANVMKPYLEAVL